MDGGQKKRGSPVKIPYQVQFCIQCGQPVNLKYSQLCARCRAIKTRRNGYKGKIAAYDAHLPKRITAAVEWLRTDYDLFLDLATLECYHCGMVDESTICNDCPMARLLQKIADEVAASAATTQRAVVARTTTAPAGEA